MPRTSQKKETKTKKTASKKKTTRKDKKTKGATPQKTLKKVAKKEKVEKKKTVEKEKPKEKKVKYTEGIGRRKTSVARVRLYETKEEKGKIIINKKTLEEYFPVFELQKTILFPLEITENSILNDGKIEVLVKGGGKRGQAEAIRLGIARLINTLKPQYKTILKSHNLLRRDPRMVERKKFGLKKARRAPQWQKR
jgi:small subunit ribosomal protein S9